MRKFINLFVVFFCGLILNSCTKDSDVFVVDPGQITGPDTVWYASVTSDMPASKLQNSLVFAADRDSVNIDNITHTITFASGLTCTFPANAFVTNSGSAISGKVDLESYLLKKKGDLIKMAKQTISNNRTLVSGGTIFLQGKKDGAIVKLGNDKKIKLQFDNNYISSAMTLFDGDNTDPSISNWTPCADTISNYNKILTTANGYEYYTNRMQWMNCNYFYNLLGGDSVKVALTLPPTFTNFNTIVYVVLNDLTSVVKLKSNASLKQFISNELPAGKSVTLVTLTKEGNFYYLGHNGFVTSNSSSDYQNININPTRVTFDELKNYLDNL